MFREVIWEDDFEHSGAELTPAGLDAARTSNIRARGADVPVPSTHVGPSIQLTYGTHSSPDNYHLSVFTHFLQIPEKHSQNLVS